MPVLARRLAALQAEVDAMRAAASNGDAEGVTTHSANFHSIVVDAAGNNILASVWRGLNIDTHTTVAVRQRRVELVAIADSHQPIVDAIASGDVEAACRTTREHQDSVDAMPHSEASTGQPTTGNDKTDSARSGD
jgi:DNA-binding GntR family transcriptional regulator